MVARAVPETIIGTVADFTKAIEKLHQENGGRRLWFRGNLKAGRKLKPSAYRHPNATNHEDLQAIERELKNRFAERAFPYSPPSSLDGWERMFLMQHFGAPTRLLDWSESPFVALYFATRSREDTGEDSVVWVLDPGSWNHALIPTALDTARPFATNEQHVAPYLEPITSGYKPQMPLAIYGTHNSARIVAQRGTFVVFSPWALTSMDDFYLNNTGLPEKCFSRLVVPKDKVILIAKSLEALGVSESTVFPDLEGLARELRGIHGY